MLRTKNEVDVPRRLMAMSTPEKEEKEVRDAVEPEAEDDEVHVSTVTTDPGGIRVGDERWKRRVKRRDGSHCSFNSFSTSGRSERRGERGFRGRCGSEAAGIGGVGRVMALLEKG